jgi:hypothetical protein
MFMDDGEKPLRGEIVFSAIAWATYPIQAEYEITMVDMGEEGCRIIFRHGKMLAAYPATREQCERHVAAFLSITQSAPTRIHGERDDYGES